MNEKYLKFLNEKGIKATAEKTIEVLLSEKSAEELAGLHNEYQDVQRKEIEKLIEEKASKEDILALKEELMAQHNEFFNKNMEILQEQAKANSLTLKKLTEREKEVKANATPFETLHKTLTDNKEEIKGLRESGKTLEFKVATMLNSTNISGGNVPIEQRIAGLDIIPSRRIRLLDIVSRGVADSNLISWVSQANKDGAAGGTTEGALKNQLDFDLVVDSQALKKRTAFIKVSDEMKDDISFITTEINNELTRELLKDIENQVYQGDDIGNNLNGIKSTAVAFAAGTFGLTVDNANIVDVLRVAMNQIRIAEQGEPTFILMHPSDVTSLKLVKVGSSDNRYIDELQLVGGNLTLDGIPIIETTLVTQDDYLVGNFSLATLWDRGSIDIQMGLDSDDFTKNLMTIRAEWRGLIIVKTNERSAFVEGDFTTDKAALETA